MLHQFKCTYPVHPSVGAPLVVVMCVKSYVMQDFRADPVAFVVLSAVNTPIAPGPATKCVIPALSHVFGTVHTRILAQHHVGLHAYVCHATSSAVVSYLVDIPAPHCAASRAPVQIWHVHFVQRQRAYLELWT